MITLTWKVDKTIPIPCPDYKPDLYTGKYPSTHCLVYHCKTITENKTAEFETEENCKSFANGAPLSCYDFRINGEILEDTRVKPQYSNLTNLTGNDATTMAGTSILSS